MTNTILLEETTFAEFALCDARLLGIAWLEGGYDLQFRLALADGRLARLTCVWASGVCIDLKYEADKAGLALSWECRFEKADLRWHMVFDFAAEGRIELDCNDARIEYEGAVRQSDPGA